MNGVRQSMSESRATVAQPLRLAYFSPLPPARSGIADYSQELLPALARTANVTLYCAEPDAVTTSLQQQFDVHSLADYAEERWQYDVALYHMGNSSHHDDVYRLMRRYPGIMVLHDYVLHHFIAHGTLGRGDFARYAREMGYALGATGISEAWTIRRGLAKHRLETLPLNGRAIDLSLGLLVHSRYVQQHITAAGARCPVRQVPAPIGLHQGEPSREALPWPQDALILASFGQLTRAKQLDRALHAFAQMRRRFPRLRYLIVGEALPEVDLEGIVTGLELGDSVYSTGYVEDLADFVDWMATADIVLNLRHPTLGETSATALRALAAGRALIVNDSGWYAELPDDVVMKVAAKDDPALLQALETLIRQPQLRQRLGQRARAYAVEHHSPQQAATAYVDSIADILHQVVWQDRRG